MNPGQQVRHYSLVCRRMCLDGAGLAGRLSSAREKGVGRIISLPIAPCGTPFDNPGRGDASLRSAGGPQALKAGGKMRRRKLWSCWRVSKTAS